MSIVISSCHFPTSDVTIRNSGNHEFHSLVVEQQTDTYTKEVSVRKPKLGIDLYSYPRIFEQKD